MSFLLDINIVSAHFKRPTRLVHRFMQHSGQMAIPTVVLGELYDWAYRRNDPTPILESIRLLIETVEVLDFDPECAEQFGRLRASLSQDGSRIDSIDLMIASVALTHDLTLVTNNTVHFTPIRGLRLVDWLTP